MLPDVDIILRTTRTGVISSGGNDEEYRGDITGMPDADVLQRVNGVLGGAGGHGLRPICLRAGEAVALKLGLPPRMPKLRLAKPTAA